MRSGALRHFSLLTGFLLCLFTVAPTHARLAKERGLPLIQTFLPEDYHSDSQNTSIVQDSTGFIYVANMNGILEFDGVRWELYRHPDRLQPLALTVDAQNRIFVGFDHDIGVLYKSSSGEKEYQSLQPFLPDTLQPTSVWTVCATPEGIFFEDWNSLLQWIPSNVSGTEGHFIIHEFSADNPYSAYVYGYGHHYIAQSKVGLFTLSGDSLVMVQGGDFFKDYFVFEMCVLDSSTLLTMSLDDEDQEVWHLFQNGTATRFETPITDYSVQYEGMELMALTDSLYALSTESGGLALFRRDGDIDATYNRNKGLPDNVVHTVTLDREDGLWLPLDHGLARLRIHSASSRFGYDQGLEGTVNTIVRHRGTLVTGTDQGCFLLHPSEMEHDCAHFIRIPHLGQWTWDMLSARDRLLVATSDTLFEIGSLKSEKEPRVVTPKGTQILAIDADSSYVLYGDWAGGLGYLAWNNEGWQDKGFIEGTEGIIRNIVRGYGNEFWVTVDDLHLERITLETDSTGGLYLTSKKRFGVENGLPGVDFYYPFLLHGRIYVGSFHGLYRYFRDTQTFVKDSTLFDTGYRTIKSVSEPVVDYQGRIWFSSEPWEGLVATPQPYGKYLISAPLHQGLNRIFYTIYPESDGVVWAGGPGSLLIRYNESCARPDTANNRVYIRNIIARGDSLNSILRFCENTTPLTLAWKQNSIRFEYALPHFDRLVQNEYQYRLVGLNSSWSAWSREAYHDYENLREGKYRFEVRGRDATGNVGEIASLSLRVLPPLHRSYYAYAFYILFLILIVIVVQRQREASIRRTNRRLEQEVEERTRSMEESLDNLQHEIDERERAEKERTAYQEQFQQAQRMESVGRLAGGLAHDFNNLLSVIHGHASVALADKSITNHMRTELTLIIGTAERATLLIRELLSYSRRQATHPQLLHLGKLVDQLAPMIDRLLAPRVEFKIEYIPNLWTVKVDSQQVEQAILNLAINARDAIQNAGHFTLSLANFIADEEFSDHHPKIRSGDYVHLMAVDNGEGIPEENRSKVFEPFFTTKGEKKGTGLGLASVYTTIDQAGGAIWVESEVGVGTVFHLLFPKAKVETEATV